PPQNLQTFSQTYPLPTANIWTSPSAFDPAQPDPYDPDNDKLLLTSILSPNSAIYLQNATYYRGWMQGSDWSTEALQLSMTSDHSFETLFSFTDPLPGYGDAVFYFEFDDGNVMRQVTSTQRLEPVQSIPNFTITQYVANEDETMATFTVDTPDFVSLTGGGLAQDDILYSGDFSGSGTPFTVAFELTHRRTVGDWIFYLLFGEDEFSYNIPERIEFPPQNAPQKPQNISISTEGDLIILIWEEVPGCTYNVYSSSEPYNSPASWNVEETGLNTTTWSGPLSAEKRFYFVKAVN
ncbi:MAG: hypothetical protein JW996_07490, partial [Candidatus Cloacimonetes bacterium]|nr:hypothetical protein [Candidatus Cloacimonadota bacterium]